MQNLARISLVESKDKNNVLYKDLAQVVNSDDTLQFLQGKHIFCIHAKKN